MCLMLRASSLGLRLRPPSSGPTPCSITRTSTAYGAGHIHATQAALSTTPTTAHAHAARRPATRDALPHTLASETMDSPSTERSDSGSRHAQTEHTDVPPPTLWPADFTLDGKMHEGKGYLPVRLTYQAPPSLHLSSHPPRRQTRAMLPEDVQARWGTHVNPEKHISRGKQAEGRSTPEGFADHPLSDVERANEQPTNFEGLTEDEEAIFQDGGREPTAELLNILAETSSLDDAWSAYHALATFRTTTAGTSIYIPPTHLRRLAWMLTSARPRTRTIFMRLLAVLASLQRAGGRVLTGEWNALLTCAGNGWRKMREHDFRNALDIYEDFIQGAIPGTALASRQGPTDEPVLPIELEEVVGAVQKPDIVTYTALISIASRIGSTPALRHALRLLKQSRLEPTHVTHLAILQYFTRRNDFVGVRATLSKLQRAGHKLQIDGANAVMWAYGFNHRLHVAGAMYRVLRNNVVPEESEAQQEVQEVRKYLEDTEGIFFNDAIIPDAITYTLFIQCLAYRGELVPALQAFMDMLTTPDHGSSSSPDAPGDGTKSSTAPSTPPPFTPTLPVFRALFLGFARHAQPRVSEFQRTDRGSLELRLRKIKFGPPASTLPSQGEWTQDRLHMLFRSFLALPADTRPRSFEIYWILIAFDKVSGHNLDTLRTVYGLLEKRFGRQWGGRIARFKESIFGPATNQ